jgi:hypothetical protein
MATPAGEGVFFACHIAESSLHENCCEDWNTLRVAGNLSRARTLANCRMDSKRLGSWFNDPIYSGQERESMDTREDEAHPPLTLKVAAHLVEDLGLNLYTSLPRVLVEYIANAYDADASNASITIDKDRITAERKAVKAEWDAKRARAKADGNPAPRERAVTLPSTVAIVIEDAGHGMSRNDLQDKFLWAGRRRRGPQNEVLRSPKNRLLMGRKGLGKLAGFGVAQTIRITTRIAGATEAISIELRYDEILHASNVSEIPVHEQVHSDGGGLPAMGGTRVELFNLLYEPMGTSLETIEKNAADHFSMIDPAEFTITLNGAAVFPTLREFGWAWPSPELSVDQLVEKTYEIDGTEFQYRFRLRFTPAGQALYAKERGIRVYAHKRLTSAPSLLSADTNMHGFRMTDYLDGIVHADFLDEQIEDYVATDRQSLRWESPLLAPMYEFLSDAIKQACKERQAVRDAENQSEVKSDKFTAGVVDDDDLTSNERQIVGKIAEVLASKIKGGVKSQEYQDQLVEVVDGLSRGKLLSTLSRLAAENDPEFDDVLKMVTKLTAEQLDSFYRYVRGRVDGVNALSNIVKKVDFKGRKDEKSLHQLFQMNPWLIDAQFFQFVTSNQTEAETFILLEKELKIGAYVPSTYNPDAPEESDPEKHNIRPDLVFVIGDLPPKNVVVVELKAPNVPLLGEHFRQLQRYVRNAEKWLKKSGYPNVVVTGQLIGSFASVKNTEKAVDRVWLEEEVIDKPQEWPQYKVRTLQRVLDDAREANHELLRIWKAEHRPADGSSDGTADDGSNVPSK